jgi:hypothetical protein
LSIEPSAGSPCPAATASGAWRHELSSRMRPLPESSPRGDGRDGGPFSLGERMARSAGWGRAG